MKVAFYGSAIFSLYVLEGLWTKVQSGDIELAYVITQPDKPFGRKKELKANPIAEFCRTNGLKYLAPEKLKTLDFDSQEIKVDLAIVAAYGKIIPQRVLDSAQFGFLNFHGSVLPKYRGACPIQMSILNRETKTGITLIKMDKGMDTGDILLKQETAINPSYTYGELRDILGNLSRKVIIDENILFNPDKWILIKQEENKASYCYVSDMEKAKLQITPQDTTEKTIGKIKAANPEPIAWVEVSGQKFNLIECSHIYQIIQRQNDILNFIKKDKKLFLTAKDGLVEINKLQPEGKKIMSDRDFINGYSKVILTTSE